MGRPSEIQLAVQDGGDDAPRETIMEPAYRQDSRPACFRSTFQEVLFVLTTTMAIAMSSLLSGSITVTSSYIGRDLNMTTAEITWITSANSLTAGAFLLLFGKFADLTSKKLLFVGSLFLFAVFALIASFADSAIALDVLTGILGLTNASAVPPAVALLGSTYEDGKRKNYAFACFAAGNPLGGALGAIIGGIAATAFNWRASFVIVSVISLIFTIIGFLTVPRDTATDKAKLNMETIKRFDLLGVFFIVSGLGLFSAALTLGDTAGWSTGYVLVLLIVGIALMAAFIVWDMWYIHPLIPMEIFKDRDFSVCLSILSLGFMAFIPGSFFLALYFQDVWNMSPIMVAVHLLPMFIVGLAVNVVAGAILHRVSNKLLMWIATASYPIAFLLFAFNRASSSYWAFAFTGQCFLVLAVDIQFNVCNMFVISSLPRSQQGIAGGLLQTAVRLATTLGFAIGVAVFNSVEKSKALGSYWDDRSQPYAAVFWASFGYSGLSLCLVYFLKIGKQGQEKLADG